MRQIVKKNRLLARNLFLIGGYQMFRSHKFVKVAVVTLAIIFIVSVSAFAEYNRDHVVTVMRNNMSLMREIGQAAAAEDWILTAQKFFAIAEGMVGILEYDPPKGTKEAWYATIEDFIFTAYVGIGASGARDVEALQEAIGKLRMLNGEGHATFR